MADKETVDPATRDVANHTPAMLQSLRREMAAVLENQQRDRQLLTRLYDETTREFGRLRVDVADLRRDVQEMKSDMLLLDNKLLSRHSEILQTIRRHDALGAPAEE